MRRRRADRNFSISVTSGEKKDIYSNNNNIISAKSDFFFKLSFEFRSHNWNNYDEFPQHLHIQCWLISTKAQKIKTAIFSSSWRSLYCSQEVRPLFTCNRLLWWRPEAFKKEPKGLMKKRSSMSALNLTCLLEGGIIQQEAKRGLWWS